MQCTTLAKPETKLPPSKWFDSGTLQEVVANTKYIHPATGARQTHAARALGNWPCYNGLALE